MVGGTVVETLVLSDRVWINVVDDNETRNDKCAIYVERSPEAERVKPGDAVWWQSGYAMWTPYANRKPCCAHAHHVSCQRVGVDYDIKLKRIGFSGVSRPTASAAPL